MKFKLSKEEKILGSIIICLVVVMYGGVFNLWAQEANGGKMPFLANYHYIDNEYFSFTFQNKPSLWFLSDIIPHGNGICSIGDVLMWQGLFVFPLLAGLYAYIKLKDARKNEKPKNIKE